MNDFCHCQTYRRNHQGISHKLLWDPRLWLRSLGAEQSLGKPSTETYKVKFSADGLSIKVHFVLATKQGLYQTGKPPVNRCIHMKFQTLATDWASRVITSAPMTTTHVHAHKNQNLGEGIWGLQAYF